MLRPSLVAGLVLQICLWHAPPAAGQADAGYRLAGIVVTADERLAIIEKRDGGQALYRPGDRLEGFAVESIEAGGVRLVAAEQSLFLALKAVPPSPGEITAIARARAMVVTDGYASQALDYSQAQRAIRKLNARFAASGTAATEAPRREPALSGEIAVALGLPQATVIKAVDRNVVRSPRETLLHLATRIEAGQGMRLEIDGIPGVQVLYARPDERL